MSATHRVLIVGASVGGVTAAETLRQEGFDGEIVVIGEESGRPYLRPPLSKQILHGDWEPEQASIQIAEQAEGLEIDLRTSCVAEALDVERRVVSTSLGELRYDELVIATGSEPRRHPALPGALVLRTMDDALALRDGMSSARRVGIVGTGVLGSEIASAARAHGVDTLLVGRSSTLTFGGVGPLLSSRLIQLHRDNGVDLRLDREVTGSSTQGTGTAIEFDDGRTELVDLVVTMIGATPRTGWLSSSSLTIADGVVCDSVGRAAPGVSAVGDVAAWEDPFTGRPARVEHQSNAIEQAVMVALRLARDEPAVQPVPLFWSEVHGTRIQAYGWFDPAHPLASIDGSAAGSPSVLVSRDAAQRVRGAVGWNASPREFRTARAEVLSTPVLSPL